MANPRVCSIPNCDKTVLARGWCGAHLYHWRKHGDPLGGGTKRGEPLKFLLERVMKHPDGECIRWPFANANGYGQIYMDGKVHRVNRIICEMVHGPAPSSDYEAAHSCGKGHEGCCSPHHLSWKTHRDNVADAKYVHRTWNHGEKVPQSRLTAQDVKQIRALKGVLLQREIAAQFGIPQGQVSQIMNRVIWASVPD